MEGAPQASNSQESFEHHLRAIQVLEEKYRRGDIRLEDLLYGYDQMQAKFYEHLNPDKPDYRETWQAAVTHDGLHYTKLKAVDADILTVPQKRYHDLCQLLERIGRVLDRETTERALVAVRDPNLTEEGFRDICSNLLSKTISRLNGT